MTWTPVAVRREEGALDEILIGGAATPSAPTALVVQPYEAREPRGVN
jgi:hypothetical protein